VTCTATGPLSEAAGNASRAETVFRLALLLYSFVEDTFTQERGSKKGYLLFFSYFSSSSIYLFNIRDIDLHHRIDILSTEAQRLLQRMAQLPRFLSLRQCST